MVVLIFAKMASISIIQVCDLCHDGYHIYNERLLPMATTSAIRDFDLTNNGYHICH